MDWPPRSPDLTMMDFWLWGHLKQIVYGRKPKTMEQLKEFIVEAFEQLNSNRELISEVYQAFKVHLQKCAEKEGGIFE